MFLRFSYCFVYSEEILVLISRNESCSDWYYDIDSSLFIDFYESQYV